MDSGSNELNVTLHLTGILSKWGFDAVSMLDDFYEKTKLDARVVSSSELLHHAVSFIVRNVNEHCQTAWKIEYIHSSGNCTRIVDDQKDEFEKWVYEQDNVIFIMDYSSLIYLYAESAALKWKGASETAYYFRNVVDESLQKDKAAKTAVVDLKELLKLVDSEATLRKNGT